MKIVFFGTPGYVIPILNKLHKSHEIIAVVTQKPKPAGRDKRITYSEVDHWAHKRKIKKLFDFDNLPEADLGICAAYGKIIPQNTLNQFKFGILNVHPSLLPKYRGASPIQAAIINGDQETGVTVIKMDKEMDHGPILSSFKENILTNDSLETLRTRLFDKSSEFLIDLIPYYIKGKIKLKPQEDEKATYTKIITKKDGFVDLEKDKPHEIERKLRAFTPWPGIWTTVTIKNTKKRLKILEFQNEPLKVQLEGKNSISWNQFKKAYEKFS